MQAESQSGKSLSLYEDRSGTVVLNGLSQAFSDLGLSVTSVARMSGMPARTVQKIYEGQPVRMASIEKLFSSIRDAGIGIDSDGKIVPYDFKASSFANDPKVAMFNGKDINQPYADQIAVIVGQAESLVASLQELARLKAKSEHDFKNAPVHRLLQSRKEINFYTDIICDLES